MARAPDNAMPHDGPHPSLPGGNAGHGRHVIGLGCVLHADEETQGQIGDQHARTLNKGNGWGWAYSTQSTSKLKALRITEVTGDPCRPNLCIQPKQLAACQYR